jgi:hypothetical protein
MPVDQTQILYAKQLSKMPDFSYLASKNAGWQAW